MTRPFDPNIDVKVEILLSAADAMVWGLSKWGTGTKWGATNTQTWVDLLSNITQIELTHSVQSQENIAFGGIASQLTIPLYTELQSPDINPFIRIGAFIKASYRDPYDAGLTWYPIFYGKIRDYDIKYDPDRKPLITLNATSELQDILSRVIPDFSAPAEPAANRASRITAKIQEFYPSLTLVNVNYESGTSFKEAVTQTVTIQELLQQFNYAFHGWQALRYSVTGDYVFEQTYLNTPFTATNLLTNIAVADYPNTNATYSQLSVSEDGTNLANTITVQDSNGTNLTTVSNSSSIYLYGSQPQTYAIDYSTEAQAFTWASEAVLYKPSRVYTIEVPATARTGRPLFTAELAANQGLPAYVNIEINQNGVDRTEAALITRHNHLITPNGWLVTIEAVKEWN